MRFTHTAVGEGHAGDPARLEHTMHLGEELDGLRHIIDAQAVGDHIKGVVVEWELWVCVEVLHLVLGLGRVGHELEKVQPECHTALCLVPFRIVRSEG